MLEVDPSSPSTIYAGTIGAGVYKSVDGGRTWSRRSNGLPRDSSITGLELAPSDPTTLYLRHNNTSRLFVSTDGGGSWRALPVVDTSFSELVVHPTQARTLYLPSSSARTEDAPHLGTVVLSPDRPELRLAPRLFELAVAHEGGNARYSRHLRTLMLEAGFARTQGVAHAPEVYGDAASTRWFADFAVGLFAAPRMTEVIVGEGWASQAELDAMIAGLRDWAELPDAFASWLYCGALGWTS